LQDAGNHTWKDFFRFRGSIARRQELVVGTGSFLAILAFWQALAMSGLVAHQFLPTPIEVWNALFNLFAKHNFIHDIGISIYRVWTAFLLAALMAIPLGILMSAFPIVRAINEPVIDFIRYLPVPALVPLTVIWLGIGELSKITLLWMGTFFQLVLLVADDARRVPREYVEIALTVGGRPRHLLRHIILPAMLPNMVDNLRITLGWCWTYLIIAEIVAANSGIGHVIWAARRYVKTPEVFAGILTIGVIGLVTDQAIRYAHKRWFAYLR
jgi:NitT/TauT family transport system permease protein